MPDEQLATLFVDVGNTSIGVARFAAPDGRPEESTLSSGRPSSEESTLSSGRPSSEGPTLSSGRPSSEGSPDAGRWWQTPLDHWHWRPDQTPPWEALEAARDGATTWVVASVNRNISRGLWQAVRERFPEDVWQPLESRHFPMETCVADKSAVGADRLAAVVAANALRDPGRAAVVVDAGSAINVELVDEAGVFQGGAILPGMAMAARALAFDTDLLPTVQPADSPPLPMGRDTNEAIRSGLYWGAWGAIRELADRMAQHCSQPPHLMLTGGGVLWRDLQQDVEVHPHLVLSGIALAWSKR